jgi:hypothetical protein
MADRRASVLLLAGQQPRPPDVVGPCAIDRRGGVDSLPRIGYRGDSEAEQLQIGSYAVAYRLRERATLCFC